MTTQTVKKPASQQHSDFEQKLQKLRELYADASEISKTALENVIRVAGSEPLRCLDGKEGKRRPHRRP